MNPIVNSPLLRRIRRLGPLDSITDYNDSRIVETVWNKTQIAQIVDPPFPTANISTVLDFGGGAGYHYWQARVFNHEVRWAIVETPVMVEYCNAHSSSANLHWFIDIRRALFWLNSQRLDLVHCNGALQYTNDPLRTLTKLISTNPRALYYDRTLLSTDTAPRLEYSFLSDHGPDEPSGPEARVLLTARPIQRSMFLNAHWNYTTESLDDPWHFRRR